MTQLKIGRYEFQNFQFLISTTKKIELWKVLLCPVRNWVYMPRRFFMWVKKQLGAQVEENDPLCWFSRGVSTSGNSKHNFRRCPITICVQVHFNFHVLVQTSLNRKSWTQKSVAVHTDAVKFKKLKNSMKLFFFWNSIFLTIFSTFCFFLLFRILILNF